MSTTTATTAITPQRQSRINTTIKIFITGFLHPISPANTSTFTSIYHPSIHWYDHAFHVCRIGHDAIIGLQKGFTFCNDPFDVEIKKIIPTENGCVLEQVWIGLQARDIVRPDGAVAVKASGKSFRCHVCMIIEIDDEGLIRRIDEYYNKKWDEGINEAEYAIMK